MAYDNYSTLSSVGSVKETRNNGEVLQKSALQQLKDLSILIGGNFPVPTQSYKHAKSGLLNSSNQEKISKSPNRSSGDEQKLRKSPNTIICNEDELRRSKTCETSRKSSNSSEEKTRRASNTSGDSGKGSGSGQTGISSNSPGRVETQEPEPCIFRPDCQECMTLSFFRNPYDEFQKDPALTKRSKIGRRKQSKVKLKGKKIDSKKYIEIQQPRRYLKYNQHSRDENGFKNLENCNCTCELENSKFYMKKRSLNTINTSPISSSSGNGSMDDNLFTITEEDEDYGNNNNNNNEGILKHGSNKEEHKHKKQHPRCWLSPDPTMGWSDLESLYSENVRRDIPLEISGECLTCWKELSDAKDRNSSNSTIDRTKRMFIWLNKRPKEFSAPWWEAKKEASLRWILGKAHLNQSKESTELIPFAYSKKDKTKLRLRDEVSRNLSNGKIYTMALSNLFHSTNTQTLLNEGEKFTLWEIIKILSRKGVYVAQPSDMKLTEGTLRQRKPIRIAAHIALIEALMNLYAKELMNRERVSTILGSFGYSLRPDAHSPEQLVISWINSAITTLKAYILSLHSMKQNINSFPKLQRWLNVNLVSEIRDLNDGVGISALFALYFSNEVRLEQFSVPEPSEVLNIYEMTENHSLIKKFCNEFFPENIYHLAITDFLYIHGYMKQNILAFLIDLFKHLELNPIVRVNRLTSVPLRVQL